MIYIAIGLTFFYVALIAVYIFGWLQLPHRQVVPNETYLPRTSVCVIVPARNEATHIAACLRAIVSQQYPPQLLEIIAIDDHSTDNTADIIAQFEGVQLIRLAEVLPCNTVLTAYKKKAIEIAIAQTQQTLIVTTDADCTMPPDWLATLVCGYEEHEAHIVAAPVQYIEEKSFIERFQSLDMIGMMVATGASLQLHLATMCNGANLAYRRQTFYEVGGFAGIDHIASGDDMLLMAKIAQKYPAGVLFIKQLSAAVYTYAQPTLSDFVQQRLRWASKSAKYQDWRITFFLAGVYLFNACIVGCLVWAAVCGSNEGLAIGLGQFVCKNIADAVFLGLGCRFFGRTDLLRWFVPAQIAHVLYIVLIGAWGNLGSYTWKGRQVR